MGQTGEKGDKGDRGLDGTKGEPTDCPPPNFTAGFKGKKIGEKVFRI